MDNIDKRGGFWNTLITFMAAVGLDLTSDQTPPRTVLIDVLAKEDVGTIVTGSGVTLNLKKVRPYN